MTRDTAHQQATAMRAGMDLARSRRLARQLSEMRADAGRSFAKNATLGTAALFAAILAFDSNADALAVAWNDRAAPALFPDAMPEPPELPVLAAKGPAQDPLLEASVVETAAQAAPVEPPESCDVVLGDKVDVLSLSPDSEDARRAALDMVQHALSCPMASVTTLGSLELFELGLADLQIRWTPARGHLALSLVDAAADGGPGVDTQFIGDAVVVNIR